LAQTQPYPETQTRELRWERIQDIGPGLRRISSGKAGCKRGIPGPHKWCETGSRGSPPYRRPGLWGLNPGVWDRASLPPYGEVFSYKNNLVMPTIGRNLTTGFCDLAKLTELNEPKVEAACSQPGWGGIDPRPTAEWTPLRPRRSPNARQNSSQEFGLVGKFPWQPAGDAWLQPEVQVNR
jgi:hypothetical protein